ncbi:MAG: hypothetical protein U5N55_06865 [Cypionkella sp.]|nr:hypothetical protein [Cypionkella sp.]
MLGVISPIRGHHLLRVFDAARPPVLAAAPLPSTAMAAVPRRTEVSTMLPDSACQSRSGGPGATAAACRGEDARAPSDGASTHHGAAITSFNAPPSSAPTTSVEVG